MNISGNTVLLTGATSGIGRALALRLAALGNTVVAVGRDEARLAELAALAALHPGPVHPVACDLTAADAPAHLAERVARQFPHLNVLINNAGVQHNYRLGEDAGGDEAARVAHEIHLNLTVPVQLVSLLLPGLRRQPAAAIVNVSSGLGLVPKQSAPVYCATKAGLHLFTKALGYQLAGSAVRVLELIPPLVDTPMTAGRGTGKISPDQLVDEFLRGFARDRPEINIGKVKLLRLVQRLSPALADRLLRDS